MSLDPRRARLWQAIGLGPQWLERRHEGASTALPERQIDAPPAGAPRDGGRARGASIARMPWVELEAAVQGCTACELHRSRRQTVFGVGNRQAPWMLIGEAPGAEEDARGEPFVGQAGRLLDNMLAQIGCSRSGTGPGAVFIANVLKCRPPGNRNPQPDEVACCAPFLLRQIELVAPKIIVVMGRFAAQSVLHTDATIAALRGRVHRLKVGEREVPVVVTYHPAYLLRNLADKAKSWADLCLARDVFDGRRAVH